MTINAKHQQVNLRIRSLARGFSVTAIMTINGTRHGAHGNHPQKERAIALALTYLGEELFKMNPSID